MHIFATNLIFWMQTLMTGTLEELRTIGEQHFLSSLGNKTDQVKSHYHHQK